MKKILIFSLSLFCSTISFGQKDIDKEYLVVTYESSFNKGEHNKQYYYWVVESSNLDELNSLSPFYFTGYSKTLLEKCINKEEVPPFYFTEDEKWDFETDYITLQKTLPDIVLENKKLVMMIRKKWTNNGLKEKMRVYVTPIKGTLCGCQISKDSGLKINYNGMISLPIKNIRYNTSFDMSTLNVFELNKKMRTNNVVNRHF